MRYCYYHYYKSFCMIFCAVGLLTAEIKPVKPGFSIAHKPAFTDLKNGRVTRVFRYPGTRVAVPICNVLQCSRPTCNAPL